MYQETSEPLSTEDYNVIAEKKSELLKYLVIIPVFIIVVGFLISLAINAEDFKDVKGIFFGFLSFMVLIACGAIFYMYNSVQKAGQNGVKTVIVGIINEKKTHKIKKNKTRQLAYSFVMEKGEIQISEQLYNKYDCKQVVQFDILPDYEKTVLKSTLIQS